MNKKGIELSINFLVTLIIAIVVFGMGLFLANMILIRYGKIQGIVHIKKVPFLIYRKN